MKKLLLLSLLFISFSAVSFAGNYKIDNEKIDLLFASADEISIDNLLPADLSSATCSSSMNTASYNSDPNPWAAWAICWVVGEFGVHRHYLGTSSSMWALYTFTCCGIFGIVPLVDWVVLLVGAIQNDVSKYVNNEKFFMW